MTIAVEVSTKPAPATKDTATGKPPSDADTGEKQRADADLHRAEPEDLAPQAPQPRWLHFEADDEQEHHDAEFGDVKDGLGLGEDAQAERADDQAGGEIAEDGAEPHAPEDRHGDDAGGQQRHYLNQFAARCCFCRHALSRMRKPPRGRAVEAPKIGAGRAIEQPRIADG